VAAGVARPSRAAVGEVTVQGVVQPLVSISDVLRAEERRPEAMFCFPADFRWGVSTAGNSVEGYNLDSDWWAWEQEPGRIKRGHTSGIACNWWRNAEADFDRAASLGLNALRLSVEWSRVEPGPGVFDDHVLDRYGQMLRALRERDIEPMVTLHHFSSPLWVTEQGGWEQHKFVALYARYVRHVVQVLEHDCDLWCTFNDPNLFAHLAYEEGVFPPGKSVPGASLRVLRHMLEAHGAAYDEIHAVQRRARVGIAHNVRSVVPVNPELPEDRRAARRVASLYNRAVVTVLAKGRWPLGLGFGLALGLRRKLDWIGVSYYGRDVVQFDPKRRRAMVGRRVRGNGTDLLSGGYGQFYPEGLFDALQRLSRLGLPLYITENGVSDDGDGQRPRYLVAHLYEIWRAIQQSFPVAGYYHRTLVDCFEWADGWTQRFGLFAFDPGVPRRRPRRSARLYSDIVRSNTVTSELIDEYAPRLRSQLLPDPAAGE
jgi:beta-glucosidase